MKNSLLIASGIAIGAASIILIRAFRKPSPVDVNAAKKAKNKNKIIGFSAIAVGAGLMIAGIKAK